MVERRWTGPQQDAITARGGSVLVSAAAGSGKTAVLVERVVQLICDAENPVDADRLLVVTFSRAAAAEMRQRAAARVLELLRDNPGNLHLQRQQALLDSAMICTVDSFCLDLVRQNFQDLELSPDFSIADKNETDIMKRDCALECIGRYYEKEDNNAFLQLVELLSSTRDDTKLVETVLRIYEFSSSRPFFEEWTAQKLGMYDPEIPVGETVWGRSILEYAQQSLRYCIGLALDGMKIIDLDEKLVKAYRPAFESDIIMLEECLAVADAHHWDMLVERLRGFSFKTLGRVTGENSRKAQVQDIRKIIKKTVQELSAKHLNATGAEFAEDILALRPLIAVLFEITAEFSQLFLSLKKEKKRLDFSDLEHYALALLVQKEGGRFLPTAKAAEIAAQFDHVLVDEYQDTNEVQDLIFSSVSRNQENLFMVGDVKQSIYAFRQAMPEIFMMKKKTFSPYATGEFPAKIMLDTNFRSRYQVTQAVNAICSLVMSEAVGDVEYDEAESLKCGAQYIDYPSAQPELRLFGIGDYDGDADPAAIEARGIAAAIRDMLDSGYMVEEKGQLRRAALRDFCILMRSPKGRAEIYLKELSKLGIAADTENAGGYLDTREVSAVTSLLKALDNPLLDIELTAAMMSPLFGFDAEDIAHIRLCGRGMPFYSALAIRAREDEKTGAFMTLFSKWRTESAVLPADRLIMRIYNDTDAPEIFRAVPLGENRRANLLLLIEYAADYHKLGYKQLGGFVAFLGRMSERKGDLSPSPSVRGSTDSVRIMSIHRSKGLEFPVVFLADTARRFNMIDLRQNTLLHPQYGFACVRRDRETLKQFSTIPMQSIKIEMQRSILSEEMRLLYVALTRAREKLIVTGTFKTDLKRRISALYAPLQDGKLPAYVVGEAACYADWVIMALLHHPSCAVLRETADREDLFPLDSDNPWQVTIKEITGEALPDAAGETATHDLPAVDLQLLDTLQKRADYRYPFEAETKIPAKFSVSSIAKGEQDIRYRFAQRPKFLENIKLTPAERGNAMHKFMQFADYGAARDSLEDEIERMRSEKFLSQVECDCLNREKLKAFFESDLARRIFKSEKVYRELKFTAECGQDMLGDSQIEIGEGKVVLQGVADCVFIENDTAVIVDYKTDIVKSGQELLERYHTQLELYRNILGKSLGMPVSQCIIYSFCISESIEI